MLLDTGQLSGFCWHCEDPGPMRWPSPHLALWGGSSSHVLPAFCFSSQIPHLTHPVTSICCHQPCANSSRKFCASFILYRLWREANQRPSSFFQTLLPVAPWLPCREGSISTKKERSFSSVSSIVASSCVYFHVFVVINFWTQMLGISVQISLEKWPCV